MIIVNFICDDEDCSIMQGVEFEQEQETYGDLLSTMREAGWTIVGGPRMNSTKTYCRAHGGHSDHG